LGKLANFGWIIRPLIPVSDNVRHGHPFDDKFIRSAELPGGDINCYV
jgi:hypothetical protein